MKVSIFGLGYVGCVSAACLASLGHEIIGVDVNPEKVKWINEGKPTVSEKDLENMVSNAVREGQLSATQDVSFAVGNTDVSLVSVGTPSSLNGSIDLTHIQEAARQIGLVLALKDAYHVVGIRSTVLPGTVENIVIPVLEGASGKKVTKDFGVCVNPEFLREGSAVWDFFNPERTVIGSDDEKTFALFSELYAGVSAPIIKTNVKTAEMIKYVDNSFHGLKMSFANEIGRICKSMNLDSHKVMEIFCMDKKLNLSPYYFKPGPPFGGSCIPKDTRAILHYAALNDVPCPLIGSILPSNQLQMDAALDLIIKQDKKNIGILGIAFKEGTDDLRESPAVEIVEMLVGKGFNLRIYDRDVFLPGIFGANRDYIECKIPHLARLFVDDPKKVVQSSDVVVITKKTDEYASAVKGLRPEQVLIDFVRLVDPGDLKNGQYVGLCW